MRKSVTTALTLGITFSVVLNASAVVKWDDVGASIQNGKYVYTEEVKLK